MFKTLARAVALAAAFALALAPVAPAVAQTYPVTTPTYTPNAILAPASLSATGSIVFTANNAGTLLARVAGTYTGLTAVVEGTNETGANPTWTQLRTFPLGGRGTALTITNNGTYRVAAAGFAKVRFRVTAISTGSVSVAMSGSVGPTVVMQDRVHRETYSATVLGLTPAASATDFFTLTGAAGYTIRIKSVECSGISTANATATIVALRRSTANTAGTSTAATAIKHDSNSPNAVGTVLSYTANPTTGNLVGNLRAGKLTTVTAASTTVPAARLGWVFGDTDNMDVTLRGAGEVFALNAAGVSFSAGTALDCSISWTEE